MFKKLMVIVSICLFFNLLTVSIYTEVKKKRINVKKIKKKPAIKKQSAIIAPNNIVVPNNRTKPIYNHMKSPASKIMLKKQVRQQQNFDEADALFGKRTKIKKKPSPASPIPIPYPNISNPTNSNIQKKRISKNKKGTKLKPVSDGTSNTIMFKETNIKKKTKKK